MAAVLPLLNAELKTEEDADPAHFNLTGMLPILVASFFIFFFTLSLQMLHSFVTIPS
ncbi:hypothetical protein LCY76_16780 [Fictibacillus sp. KIGAM418]|uniref:Uncharacterized protein n=1 Tax=Fictibacillus marinisediminis TaxID=2878389 RepID=A0A9X1XCM2_9BACL|nr:hypothetical protein [Fictibacillus marinisediminis]MCK6258229.1 hypothetical protein [Fictibacillus marinisediminis]